MGFLSKVRFSIGTKLILIISIIVIVSLGSITALVSYLVREDVKIAAEENNFEANRRVAAEAEDTLVNIRAVSGQLMYTVHDMEAVNYFFTQNPRVAAVACTVHDVQNIFVNNNYFISRDIAPSLAEAYFNNNKALLRATAGDTVLLNASPAFNRALLALFFPFQGDSTTNGAVGVLFDAEKLIDSFGFGTNQSFMINDQGDIIIHSDFALLQNGANAANLDFIHKIRADSERSKQELLRADFTFNTYAPDTPPALCYTAFTKISGDCIVITGIEHDKVFEGIAATTLRNIYLTIAVLFVSVMFVWFFSKTISTPLKSLTVAAKSIEGGQFEQDIHFKSRDEIGLLGASFQKMSSALHIFGRFTNREIAVKAMRGEIKPGGLPKHATIFFSDIRGFTALSENFTKTFGSEASDKIVFWLNNYLAHMIECVEKTGGVVDKFIGDAVMAHWGTAYTSGNPKEDAFNCIKAALMMRNALVALNKECGKDDPGNPLIRIGCGINTGMVTAGQIGSDLRMEYTVIGDPVNLASRIETLTKPLAADILISEDTWNLVGDDFITEEMPSVTVKGKEKRLRIFAVVNFADSKTGAKTLAEVRNMLGIATPDMSKVDLDAEEKKYKIGGEEK